jgi:RNA polymerase sigma factor (sigma-70 family)
MARHEETARHEEEATVDQVNGAGYELSAALPVERAQVVRLCARLTGDLDAAEDLAQETLFEAWRHEHKLRDQERRPQWLAGIARNVCLRWARRHGRELARRIPPPPSPLSGGAVSAGHLSFDRLEDSLADDFDIELELERAELATLLDRALGMLPPEVRLVLVERFVAETPRAEIAGRLGMSEGAVAMKLQRGKLALRRLLTTSLYREAAAHGLLVPETETWQETRMWCPYCGQRRLMGRFTEHLPHNPGRRVLLLVCPTCQCEREADLSWLFSPAMSYRRAHSRVLQWQDEVFRAAVARRTPLCFGPCRCPTPVQIYPPGAAVPWGADGARFRAHQLVIHCQICGSNSNGSFPDLALATAEGRRFWQAHPRIRVMHEQEVEVGGRPCILTRFGSVTDSAQLDVVVTADTAQVLSASAV